VNVLVLDLNLPPRQTCWKLADRLKTEDPPPPPYCSSGYAVLSELEDFKNKGFDDILPKPFHLSELKEIISRNLP